MSERISRPRAEAVPSAPEKVPVRPSSPTASNKQLSSPAQSGQNPRDKTVQPNTPEFDLEQLFNRIVNVIEVARPSVLKEDADELRAAVDEAFEVRRNKVTRRRRADELRELRTQAGAKIDPKTAEVMWSYGEILNPYGDGDLPDEASCRGRVCFARSPEPDSVWISFYDLPAETCDALRKRIGEEPEIFGDDILI